MSHCARSQMASASGPLMAVTTSKYSAVSRASISLTLATISSTTRTRADMGHSGVAEEVADGFEEFSDRDRLRQIRFASAAADPLLVALHGEGRHGDHRDRLEFGIVLEP